MENVQISLIDYVIIGLYLAFVVGLGLFLRKKQESESDYFLAGKSLLWPVIGFSLFASNMGSISLVGLAESGYGSGMGVFSYEWMAIVVLVIFALFFLPFYLKNKIYTIPEFLERRYGSMARSYFSIVTILLNVFIDIASGLFAGAIVIQMAFPELGLGTIIWGISIIAAFYTFLGGLASVVYSDTVQAILLIVSSIVVTVIAYNKVGGWEALTTQVDESFLTVIKPATDAELPWPGLFSGVFLLGFYFWITNQFIAQRALAAKDTRQGQWGALFAGFLKLSTLFIMILPGILALVLYPDLDSPKQAYPTLIFDLLPAGLLGLTLAGFIAALMSSVDSGLNAAATLFTFDFYKKFNSNVSPKRSIVIAKIAIFVFMIFAAIWAPFIDSFPSLWDYLQMILSFICPPVVALFIFGLFSTRVNKKGANSAIVAGVAMGLGAIAYQVYLNSNPEVESILPHYLYLAGVIFLVCSAILWGVSLMTEKEERDWESLIWTKKHFQAESASLAELPFYKNYRYQSIALLALVALLLILF